MTCCVLTNETLRVLLDGFGLEDGSQHRGIGTYLRQLVDHLTGREGLTLSMVASSGSIVPTGVHQVRSSLHGPARWHRLQRGFALRRVIANADADVFHSPAQLPPRHSRLPWVQTLHDLTPFVIADPVLEVERKWWSRVGPRLAAASAVICPSQSSADQAMRFLGLSASQLVVIPWAVSPAFRADGPVADPGPSPYLLWVSSWGPHKGLAEACAVVSRLAAAGYPHRLVVAGRQTPHVLGVMRRIVAASARPDRVEIAGYVEDLPALYRGAAALVVTSRAEGFGLPLLEALACGTPVVSFDNTSLPEVVGDAGLLVADGDVRAFADAIQSILDDSALASDLARLGPARAAGYTWAAVADAHLAVYGDAAR